MFRVHIIHGLGNVTGVVRRYVTCYKTLGTCYLACSMALRYSLGTHNMGGYECKTWQGEKNKFRAKGKKICCSSTLYTHCINIYGHFVKLGLKERVSKTASSKKQCSPHFYIPFIFYVRTGSCKICVTWGSGTTFVVGEESFKSVRMLLRSVCKSVHVQQQQQQQHGKKKGL